MSDTMSVAASEAASAASTLALPGADVEPDLRNATIHGGDGKNCCTCSGKSNSKDFVLVRSSSKAQPEEVWRCKACHNLKSRINRIMSKNGSLAKDWSEMSESERSSFIKDNSNLYGAELELKITETLQDRS